MSDIEARNRWEAARLRFLADKIESHDVEFQGDPQWLSDDDRRLTVLGSPVGGYHEGIALMRASTLSLREQLNAYQPGSIPRCTSPSRP